MNTKPDGGPAFPHPINKHEAGMQYKIVDGMSLRDWFAGQALAAGLNGLEGVIGPDESQADFGKRMSAMSYAIADAMIAERSKP